MIGFAIGVLFGFCVAVVVVYLASEWQRARKEARR